jgi:ammonia channel protein AmtB
VVPVAVVAFIVIGKIVKMRSTPEEEVAGLDIPEMGIHGYATETGQAAIPR